MTNAYSGNFLKALVGFILGSVGLGLLVAQATWLNATLLFAAGNWLPVVIIVGSIVSGIILFTTMYHRSYAEEYELGIYGLLVAFALIFIGFGIAFWTGYAKDVQYNKSVDIVEPKDGVAQVSERNARAPWVVGSEQMAENVSINGTAVNAAYIPEKDMFSSAVIKKGVFKGWGQVVWTQIDETGQAISSPCAFSENAKRRIDGTLGANLERAILREDFFVKIHSDDFYVYCDKDTPMAVVPLLKLKGGLTPTYVPAGVAVYNGKTGDLKIHKSVKRGEIVGPMYSKFLSRKVVSSTSSADGFWSWMWNASGYQAYGGENSSELVLGDKVDKSAAFVTPMTMVGRGKAITAVGQQDASSIQYGKLNKYTIAKLPTPRQGNKAVQDRIKADHADLEWATGMSVFEIAPTGPKRWVATLGQRKSIMYTLTINPDSTSCLYSVRGTKIRCTNDKEDVGNVKIDKSDDPLNLSKLSNDELLSLQEDVQREVSKRLK